MNNTNNVNILNNLIPSYNKVLYMGSGIVTVSTIAGLAGHTGLVDGPGSNARFHSPYGITVAQSGNIYVSDRLNGCVRKITADTHIVSTLPITFNGEPKGICVDSHENVYVVDEVVTAPVIHKMTPLGVITTDSIFATTLYNYDLEGIAIGPDDNIYFVHPDLHSIWKYDPSSSNLGCIANDHETAGSADGDISTARFHFPASIAVDILGNVYVGDGYYTVRKLTRGGIAPFYTYTTSTIAGLYNTPGTIDGTGSAARFGHIFGLCVNPNTGDIYIADTSNTIRKIDQDGVVTTISGIAGQPGSFDGYLQDARFNTPFGINSDSSGNLFIADTGNSTIRLLHW